MPARNPKRVNIRHGVARKFIFHLFWFTSLITILTTALQLYLDYSRDIEHIEARMQEIKTSYLQGIITSLWVFDEELLKVQLKGICQLPDIQYVKIERDRSIIFSNGDLEAKKNILRQYPLFYTYKNEEIDLGTLIVAASLDGVYQRLIDKFLVIFAIKAVRSFLLSTFLFFIFYILVGKHLYTIASYTKSLGLNQLRPPLTLDKKSTSKTKDNELDLLVLSINEMRKNLYVSFQDIEKLNEQLQRDITERKRTEEALRNSEAQYRALFEQATDAIFILDSNGNFIDASPSACKMVGYSREELLKLSISLLIPDEDLQSEPLQLDDLKAGRVVVRERRLQRKDKRIVTVGFSGKMLEDGRIQVFARDVSKRKRTEQALQESEQRFRSLFENSPVSIWEEDFSEVKEFLDNIDGIRDGDVEAYLVEHPDVVQACASRVKIVDVNQATLRLHNAANKSELLSDLTKTFTDVSFVTFRKELVAIVKGETLVQSEGLAKTLAGRMRNIELRWSVASGFEQSLARVLVTIEDITERKQAEENLRAALAEKEVMLKEIHHRVKNNLQVISSLLNLQSRYIKDDATLSIFAESRNRVRSMALIHEKLYQTKDFSQVDFSDYARDLSAQLIRANTDNRELVRLDLDVEGIFLEIDTAVPCGLIINELLTNALQHAFPGGRKGTIKLQLHSKKPTKKKPGHGGKVVLTVSDDGVGLPEGFNIETAKTLGIQLVKTLSEQIDGVLKISSGKGAHFTITFDAKTSEKPEVLVIGN